MSSEDSPELDPAPETNNPVTTSDEEAATPQSGPATSDAPGRSHGMLIAILVAISLVAGFWFAYGRGVDKSQHFAAMSSSDHTIALLSVNDLDRS